jgi:hypothetical protein
MSNPKYGRMALPHAALRHLAPIFDRAFNSASEKADFDFINIIRSRPFGWIQKLVAELKWE